MNYVEMAEQAEKHINLVDAATLIEVIENNQQAALEGFEDDNYNSK